MKLKSFAWITAVLALVAGMLLLSRQPAHGQMAFSRVKTVPINFSDKYFRALWDVTYSTHQWYHIKALATNAFMGIDGGSVTYTASWMVSTGTYSTEVSPGITFLDLGGYGVGISTGATVHLYTDNLNTPTTVYLYLGAWTATPYSGDLYDGAFEKY